MRDTLKVKDWLLSTLYNGYKVLDGRGTASVVASSAFWFRSIFEPARLEMDVLSLSNLSYLRDSNANQICPKRHPGDQISKKTNQTAFILSNDVGR